MDEPKYDGVIVKIGGKDWTVPPLNLFRLKKLRPQIEALQGLKTGETVSPEQADNFVLIIHSALSRNYPDLKPEDVEEMVDLGNMAKIIQAVMGVSGFVQGEPVAGSGLTGMQSTASS